MYLKKPVAYLWQCFRNSNASKVIIFMIIIIIIIIIITNSWPQVKQLAKIKY